MIDNAVLALNQHASTDREIQTRAFFSIMAETEQPVIRYDIIDDLRKLYDVTGDESIRTLALALIDSEEDLKYRKKYAGLWRGV